ncbi:transcriptional regulator [Actinoplanes sp. NPDC049265]|uniref:transcriptional regulator n=1 Tax=Actinoplanes sp. NPDC049265 TaxID=3363902 RepID=UPI00371585D7
MSAFQSPQEIAQTREVSALALLQGQADLRGYPYRHLGVLADSNLSIPLQSAILMAAELLSQYGWELVSVANPYHSVGALVGFFRRPAPSTPSGTNGN